MDMDLEPGTLIDNRYVVEAEIGRGGMAAVYRVRHAQLGTHAAMKVLTMPAASIQERLMHEGRVQAALQHANIVAVSDVVVHNGAPALVMEYVRGPSLDEFLEERRVTLAQADELARGILAGVAAAHKHGLIHRDLKPANIMLAITDSGLVPKVTDFGLVKMLLGDGDSSSRTRSGVAMGTPSYMAPEQISDAKTVDARADIFSLGAILYELLSNRRTFDDEDMFKVFSAIVGGVYKPIRELVPDIPERMELAIDGALMPDRETRLPDVQTLLAVWMGEADGKGASLKPGSASTWDADLLAKVSDMGAGGESAGESLKRSLKAGLPSARPTLPAPPKARHETGATFLPHPADLQADGRAAAPRTQSTMAPIPGMFDEPMPASVQHPPSAPAAPSRSVEQSKSLPYVLFAAVAAALLIIGLVGVGGMAWAAGLFGPSPGVASIAPQPDPRPVPAAIEPAPDPEPTEAPEPEPSPVPPVPAVPTPDPVPTDPLPDPEPAPDPEKTEQPEPAPDPEPVEPAPAPVVPAPVSGPAVFLNSPGLTVHVVNANGRAVDLEKLGEGVYTVEAFFAGPSSPPTTFGPVTFSDGQSWQIKCVKGALKCNITER